MIRPFPRVPCSLVVLVVASLGCASSSQSAPGAPVEREAGAGSSVTAADIQQTAPSDPVEKALAGRVAGVIVSRSPEGGIIVRIRGASGAEPLYVVDGVPITPGPGGALSGINPSDIESIKVLKGPAETSMYGSRGASGVIVIKTKRR